MASRVGARSVKDATRFTSTIPHAASKPAAGAGGGGPAAASRATPPHSAFARLPGETPEQRVQRLRKAHIAAQKAQISQTDKLVDASRRFLDLAHRFTVKGIVLFTVVAGVVSIYSVWDMLRYNRARRAEFAEAQKKYEADELATARLAYLKGNATDEQTLLVEEANRRAEAQGVKLPPLLGAPEHRTHFEEHVKPALAGEEKKGKGVLGIVSGFFGGKQEPSDVKTAAESTAAGVVREVEQKAQVVWEQEKENQRKGGSLDQLGLDAGSQNQPPKKKGWLW
ncbi:hypothetical protein N3K66_004774 [Trichothecium roseum]|uniref:Uncharacterized protein n=1 Tax=Trichothecium roseum TaxID=47278 RepID=A0ACC0V2J5_9HYPO|nr:hypothetical protein N3K66_004774 [Trichothecium roseum]